MKRIARKNGWVVYSALLTVFVLVGETRNVLAVSGIDTMMVANWILTLVLLAATWGYALQKPLGSAGYWRAAFWIVLFATAVMLIPVALGTPEAILFTALLLALVVPAYVAAYLYAYRSPLLWQPDRIHP
jgi:Flp pilus assembly protein protease CpaA